jgi:hypothetical protein
VSGRENASIRNKEPGTFRPDWTFEDEDEDEDEDD